MEKTKGQWGTRIRAAVKAGTVGAAVSVALLALAAIFVRLGLIPDKSIQVIGGTAAFLGGLAGSMTAERRTLGKGILPKIMTEEIMYLSVLLLMAIGLPGRTFLGRGFWITAAASSLGYGAGAAIYLNALYRKKFCRRKTYNKQ